jgi:hypothetical protein
MELLFVEWLNAVIYGNYTLDSRFKRIIPLFMIRGMLFGPFTVTIEDLAWKECYGGSRLIGSGTLRPASRKAPPIRR